MKTRQSGSAILYALVGLLVVSTTSLYFYGTVQNYVHTQSAVSHTSMAQMEAENLGRIAINYTRHQIEQNFDITSVDLNTYLTTYVSTKVDPGYQLVVLTADIATTKTLGTVATGPYAGLSTYTRPVTIHIQVLDTVFKATGDITLGGSIGEIYPTQFNIFTDGWLWLADAATAITTSGRLYSGNMVTFGNLWPPTSVTSVITAASYYNFPPYWINIATNPNPGPADYQGWPFPQEGQPQCWPLCPNGMGWYNYSKQIWNGQYQDQSWGIKPIYFTVDPAGQVDTRTIQPNQKLQIAVQADIRIINGVWYLKDPNNALNWPGIPVWSDHPGRFTTWNEEFMEGTNAVGQDDIRDWLNNVGPLLNRWPAGTTPKLYSYYETDPATGLLTGDQSGIVSYGNLARTTAGVPGNWVPGDYVGDFLCLNAETCNECANPNMQVQQITSALTCGPSNVNNPGYTTRSLNATRGGFRSGVIQQNGNYHTPGSKIWTMNFDIAQFAIAMKCGAGSHPGEIGCYFGNGSFMGRPFNGAVYILNTWKGFEYSNPWSGPAWPFMQTDPQLGPYAGNNIDASQIPAHQAQQQLIPFQLCSTSKAGQPFDAAAGNNRFTIPLCANYKDSSVFAARTVAVRVFNGAFNPADFPKGLTIFSHDDMYAQGNINSNSDPSSIGASPWTPMFIGGSMIWTLSNGWDDHNARWDVPTGWLTRNALQTTYNTALSPLVPWQTFNETWYSANFVHRGPAISFPSSAFNQKWPYDPNLQMFWLGPDLFTNPYNMDLREDPHFQLASNQPPGIEAFTVFSMSTWSKQTPDELTTDKKANGQ